MHFNKHSKFEGQHAFLGASNYHWINYDDEKLDERYIRWLAVQRGTKLHELAAQAIRLGVNLPRSRKTLNMYVNDAIGFKLEPEQVLYYSENCFGTADAIGFRRDILRIHDLKTGLIPSSIHQLEVYNALFCLEYGVKPEDIQTELRIYQNDDVLIENPEPELIHEIMDKIIRFDKRIEELKQGG